MGKPVKISVTPIKSFPISGRKLCMTDEPGTLTGGIRKDGGPLQRTFSHGAVALMDPNGDAAVDPANFAAVMEFSERIIEGDQRAATQPGAVLMLATAYLALIMTWPVPAPLAAGLIEDDA